MIHFLESLKGIKNYSKKIDRMVPYDLNLLKKFRSHLLKKIKFFQYKMILSLFSLKKIIL